MEHTSKKSFFRCYILHYVRQLICSWAGRSAGANENSYVFMFWQVKEPEPVTYISRRPPINPLAGCESMEEEKKQESTACINKCVSQRFLWLAEVSVSRI